jgi:hypothetical protein
LPAAAAPVYNAGTITFPTEERRPAVPIPTQCPGCHKQYDLADSMKGHTVRCPACYQTFVIGGAAAEEGVPEGLLAEEEIPEVLPADADADRGDERLQKQPGRVNRPQAVAAEARRPAPPAPKGGTGVMLLLAGLAVGFLFLLCAGGGGLAWFIWSRASEAEEQEARAKTAQKRAERPTKGPDVVRQNWAPPPAWPKAGPPPAIPNPIAPAVPPPAQPPKPPVNPPPRLKPPTPVDVKPAALPEDKVVKQLPGTIADVAVGGNGRFLILWLPGERKLAVFDVSAANVVKYLPFTEDVKFAAGMDKLLVALPRSRVVQRYSLTTFQREALAPLRTDGELTGLCMGYASAGPLWVQTKGGGFGGRGGALFLDPSTLQEWKPDWGEKAMPGDAAYLRASADGRTFGLRNGVGGEPHTCTCVTLRDGRAEVRTEWGVSSSVLVPAPDGRLVYSGYAVYNKDLKPVLPNPPPQSFAKPYLPALGHAGYFMRLDYIAWDQLGGTLSFFLAGQGKPFATRTSVAGVSNEQIAYGGNRDKLVFDQRVFFIPAAKAIITVPQGNDQLILYRFDPEAELERSGVDYLVVTSRPPLTAKKGQELVYQLAVKSKKGGVKYKLESGPAGMALDGNGRLTWRVPAGTEGDVLIGVRDQSGQEVFHTFKVEVID